MVIVVLLLEFDVSVIEDIKSDKFNCFPLSDSEHCSCSECA